MYDIEDGYAVPKDLRGRKQKYPWSKMAVGQSFFIPMTESMKNEQSLFNTVRCSGRYFGKKHGTRYVVRKCGDGVRAWRVE